MPGPSRRSGRRQSSNRQSNYSQSIPSDDEHPFLTPNGYRIMRDRNRVMNSVPVQFPQYPIVDSYGGPIQQGPIQQGPIQQGPIIEPFPNGGAPYSSVQLDQYGNVIPIGIVPGHEVPVDPNAPPNWIQQPSLQNILPSRKYPDPSRLGTMPMTDHYESSLVADPQKTPLRAIGKLLIQVTPDASREPATGSAWIAGPSLVVTSAHNLYEFSTGTWASVVEFHPGFDYYSKEELPTCRITSCSIPKGYMQNPATNHDIAVCFVDRNIGDIVGAEIPMRPVDSNDLFENTPITIVGYPAGSGFDFGKQMWRSRGDYLFGRSNAPGDDYSPVMATDFGGGSSGCPWLIQDPGTKKLVSVGVTSAHAKLHYKKGEPNLMSLISPFFGPKLFDSLSNDHVFHEFDVA